MRKYRITFSGNDLQEKSIDVTAKSSDNALRMAFRMPEAEYFGEVSVQEIPDGPANIGIEFYYRDEYAKKDFVEYMILRAKDEAQAREYYLGHFLGRRFWFSPGKIEPDGKHIYGKIKSTYFAACPGYNLDITK